jgi:hypothetical protein
MRKSFRDWLGHEAQHADPDETFAGIHQQLGRGAWPLWARISVLAAGIAVGVLVTKLRHDAALSEPDTSETPSVKPNVVMRTIPDAPSATAHEEGATSDAQGIAKQETPSSNDAQAAKEEEPEPPPKPESMTRQELVNEVSWLRLMGFQSHLTFSAQSAKADAGELSSTVMVMPTMLIANNRIASFPDAATHSPADEKRLQTQRELWTAVSQLAEKCHLERAWIGELLALQFDVEDSESGARMVDLQVVSSRSPPLASARACLSNAFRASSANHFPPGHLTPVVFMVVVRDPGKPVGSTNDQLELNSLAIISGVVVPPLPVDSHASGAASELDSQANAIQAELPSLLERCARESAGHPPDTAGTTFFKLTLERESQNGSQVTSIERVGGSNSESLPLNACVLKQLQDARFPDVVFAQKTWVQLPLFFVAGPRTDAPVPVTPRDMRREDLIQELTALRAARDASFLQQSSRPKDTTTLVDRSVAIHAMYSDQELAEAVDHFSRDPAMGMNLVQHYLTRKPAAPASAKEMLQHMTTMYSKHEAGYGLMLKNDLKDASEAFKIVLSEDAAIMPKGMHSDIAKQDIQGISDKWAAESTLLFGQKRYPESYAACANGSEFSQGSNPAILECFTQLENLAATLATGGCGDSGAGMALKISKPESPSHKTAQKYVDEHCK